MLNYPVSDGTSGHLIGGALAAAVLGPLGGMFSITLVLLVQSLVFADGGLTALGTNVILMAVVGCLVGWAVSRGLRHRAKSAGPLALACAAAVGGLVSVVAAAAAFTGLFAVGGTVAVPLEALASQMLAVHLLIGLGEAVITGALVGALAVAAPGALALDSRPFLPTALRPTVASLTTISLLAAGVFSWAASGYPDGLEATAQAVGFASTGRDHLFAGSPLADYGAAGGFAVGLAGLIGVALCWLASLCIPRALAPAGIRRA
jgi:cobalt/nickel transport system permease protein